MKFSIITVNYASWPYTLRCVDSLYETGYEDFEVVVVDNDQESAVPEIPHPVRLIRNPENVGFARACNQGILASDGECVVLINPDTLVEGDFFEGLKEFFEENPEAGVAGPRIVDGEGNLQLSARKELGFASGFLGRTSLLTRLFPKNPLLKRLFPAAKKLSGPTVVDWVSGACMVIRRRTIEEIGPMDERFFMYFEDADLCRRARGRAGSSTTSRRSRSSTTPERAAEASPGPCGTCTRALFFIIASMDLTARCTSTAF